MSHCLTSSIALLLFGCLPLADTHVRSRKLAQSLGWTASYDPVALGMEKYGQVARSMAFLLSSMQESITPEELLAVAENSVLQYKEIYGSCIAFEPDSYSQIIAGGGASASGTDEAGMFFWANVTSTWNKSLTKLWAGHDGAVLFAPYVARGPAWRPGEAFETYMDLAEGYNYWDLSVEWYHNARTQFLEREINLTDGVWSAPYFDEGAGGIDMVTFSVPFWRDHPVEDVDQPGREQAPYGCPKQKPVYDYHGKAVYFWGIATIDINLNLISFTCQEGQIVVNGMCEYCKDPFAVPADSVSCKACPEGYVPNADRNDCDTDVPYDVVVGVLVAATAAIVVLLVYFSRRTFFIASLKVEKDVVLLSTCMPHHIRFRKKSPWVEVSFSGSGIRALDCPTGAIYAKYFDESCVVLLSEDQEPLIDPKSSLQCVSGSMRFAQPNAFLRHTATPVFVSTGGSILFVLGTDLVVLIIGIISFRLSAVNTLISLAGGFLLGLIIGAFLLAKRAREESQIQRSRASRQKSDSAVLKFHDALWDAREHMIEAANRELLDLGWTTRELDDFHASTLVDQSVNAGVAVDYLLSDSFCHLAVQRSGAQNPEFYQLKDAFFFGENPIGRDVLCPRDGRPGCALVDTLDRQYRRSCSHFLSWTWKCTIHQIRSAMKAWIEQNGFRASEVFLYMCFFVNNQYRILVEAEGTGSANLEEVFESRLRKVGRMVALLDDWHEPVYLSRIWTIFEQFIGQTIGIEIEIIMPEDAQESLINQVRQGDAGILEVKQHLSKVNSRQAKAFVPKDEEEVKRMITDTVGFETVDSNIRETMMKWIGHVMQRYMQDLVCSPESHPEPRVSVDV